MNSLILCPSLNVRTLIHVHTKFARVRGGSLSKSQVSEGLLSEKKLIHRNPLKYEVSKLKISRFPEDS